jgi:hypothetical protein
VHDEVAAANTAAGDTSIEGSASEPNAPTEKAESCKSPAPDLDKLKSTTLA